MACKICEIRRPKRSCPAVGGEICSICCGQQRETTLDCPLDCEYLAEARKHEPENQENPDNFPNQDVRLSDTFLRDNEELLVALGRAVLMAGRGTPGAVDFAVREALAALIRTQRTLESGLYYETRPENPVAAELCRRIQEAAAEFRRQETERLQMTRTRDTDVLGILVFLQRLEITRNNGRKRGRAFLDFLRGQLPGAAGQPAPASAGSLIVT
jgi:hypothetical protein